MSIGYWVLEENVKGLCWILLFMLYEKIDFFFFCLLLMLWNYTTAFVNLTLSFSLSLSLSLSLSIYQSICIYLSIYFSLSLSLSLSLSFFLVGSCRWKNIFMITLNWNLNLRQAIPPLIGHLIPWGDLYDFLFMTDP